jgi:hypothetical protein
MKCAIIFSSFLIIGSGTLALASDACGGCPTGEVCLSSVGIPLKTRCIPAENVKNLKQIIGDLGNEFTINSEEGKGITVKVDPQ